MRKVSDSHCHLSVMEFSDVCSLIENAVSMGLFCMINCSVRAGDFERVRCVSECFKEVIPFYGFHPWYVSDFDEELLVSMVEKGNCGIGEIGLDRKLSRFSMNEQEDIFFRQLVIAESFDLPVSIHCYKAWDRVISLIKKSGISWERVMFHSFSASSEIVSELNRYGCYFSFSGNIAKPLNRMISSLKNADRSRILVESDASDIESCLKFHNTCLNVIKALSDILLIKEEEAECIISGNICSYLNAEVKSGG